LLRQLHKGYGCVFGQLAKQSEEMYCTVTMWEFGIVEILNKNYLLTHSMEQSPS